ncbi:Hypothetical protein D9617_5g070180 [Elsinoe fawcettii]|nr:Hypothetical protein D9617_5g070180 [Elsinoe fawcettii]
MAETSSLPTPTPTSQDFELADSPAWDGEQNRSEDRPSFSLPPADGGRGAWLVLAASFALEAVIWGFPFSYGVFNDFYNEHPAFRDNRPTIAAVGTTSTGMMYFLAPVVYFLLRRYPSFRKPVMTFGCIAMTISMIAGSFAEVPSHLLVTQGILYGLGGSLAYFPAFIYLDEWFIARKGIAYGTLWAATGVAGFALPLLMEWILRQYGFRTALRIWAVAVAVTTGPAIYFLKGRLPRQHTSTGPQVIQLGFLRGTAFWIFFIGSLVQSLGYFLPTLYMPSFARAVGLPFLSGTIAVSVTNGSTVVGMLTMGYLSDRLSVTSNMNICAVGTILSVFLFWSFAVYLPVLYIFAVLYGIFAGGSAATWTGCTALLREKWPGTETGMLISLFSLSRGLGSVLSGPLSGALVQGDSWKGAEFAWGSGYGSVIAFSGVTATAMTFGWCGRRLGLV